MLTIISPAKSLDFDSKVATKKYSNPQFLPEASELMGGLRKLSPAKISSLMSISDKLANENFQRFNEWKTPFKLDNSRQAIFAFKGDVYLGLKAEELNSSDLNYAQNHLRILSGLYGILRPLDLMQAYRLEMGSRLGIKDNRNLYEFWGRKITDNVNKELGSQPKTTRFLINLASNEYFSSIKADEIDAEIVTPQFKDWSKDRYRMISFFAKRTRGLMAAYIIKNKIKTPAELTAFNIDGYSFCADESTESALVFKRKKEK